jgi:hypothetical protein
MPLISLSFLDVYGQNHRDERKSGLLKFCCVTATIVASSMGIFVAATNSTKKTNKAGSTYH